MVVFMFILAAAAAAATLNANVNKMNSVRDHLLSFVEENKYGSPHHEGVNQGDKKMKRMYKILNQPLMNMIAILETYQPLYRDVQTSLIASDALVSDVESACDDGLELSNFIIQERMCTSEKKLLSPLKKQAIKFSIPNMQSHLHQIIFQRCQ